MEVICGVKIRCRSAAGDQNPFYSVGPRRLDCPDFGIHLLDNRRPYGVIAELALNNRQDSTAASNQDIGLRAARASGTRRLTEEWAVVQQRRDIKRPLLN